MPVTFVSNGYDTTSTSPYTETAWSDAHPAIGAAQYGVEDAGDWKVTAVGGADRTVSIAPGFGWGYGVTDLTTENETLQLDPITSGSRWDLIAVRRDWTPTGGKSKFVKVNGGADPVIPGGRLVGRGGIDDQPIALVKVTEKLTQAGPIIDIRCWAANGGMVAADDIAKSYLNRLGTAVWIDDLLWRYQPGLNDIPEWVTGVSYDATAYGFRDTQPNYDFQGAANVTRLGDGRKRVDIDMTMVRKNIGNTVSSTRQSMGVILPAAAIGASNSKVLACPLKVGTGLVFVQVQPSTGSLTFWSQTPLTWTEEDFVSLNFTYYI